MWGGVGCEGTFFDFLGIFKWRGGVQESKKVPRNIQTLQVLLTAQKSQPKKSSVYKSVLFVSHYVFRLLCI